LHRNIITAADNVTAIITKANRGTKVNAGTTETIINIKAKAVAVMGIITSTKTRKVMGAMAIIINITTTRGTTRTTGVMVINMAASTIRIEGTTNLTAMDMDTIDHTDPTLMDTDLFITHSPTIHMYHLPLI